MYPETPKGHNTDDSGRAKAQEALANFVKNSESVVCSATLRGFGALTTDAMDADPERIHKNVVMAQKGLHAQERLENFINHELKNGSLVRISNLKCKVIGKNGKRKPVKLHVTVSPGDGI
ncbi:MAG: hypothetical protein HY053_03985 [Proteobacteria bacterium]|nr:hypothetical protein [Pseudomonadota bacterium]